MKRARFGFTMLELVVVVAIVSIVLALTLSAVQRAREAAARVRCASNLRAIAIAIHHYHSTRQVFPAGMSFPFDNEPFPDRVVTMTWHVRLLPYMEESSLWRLAQDDFLADRYLVGMPPHRAQQVVVPSYLCPLEFRRTNHRGMGMTSYLGCAGIRCVSQDGVIFYDSRTNLLGVTDGSSNTLLIGERPPSTGQTLGRWYGGWGQTQDGLAGNILGIRETVPLGIVGDCPLTPQSFSPGRIDNPCDAFHFWSLHSGGANFAFADGSVRFISYSADPIMPALATRAGGEVVSEF